MIKEKIVLHAVNLIGLAKIGSCITIFLSSKSGYAFLILLGTTTGFFASNAVLKKAKKRYPRFNRVCLKIRM